MKEPVDHIERPRLPWRSDDESWMTECGYSVLKVKTITRDAFAKRLKEYGQQRTAILTCMTCIQTAQRWATWAEDPRQAVDREIAWEGCGRYSQDQRGARLRNELKAIAVLIEKHREEFDWLLFDVANAVDLNDERRKRS